MIKIWAGNYLANRPLEKAVTQFAKRWKPEDRLLDIGCGEMPYRKYFRCQYVGLDYNTTYNPDVVADAWNTPFPDGSFDVILMLQSLEHISHTEETIAELYRLLRPGGYVFLTVPQTMKNHSGVHSSRTAPVQNFSPETMPEWRVDYYRFTKYGLVYIFRAFTVVSIAETTGYVGTLAQLVNYFLIALRGGRLFTPVYLLTNIVGLLCDSMCMPMQHSRYGIFRLFYHSLYGSLTSNYILVAQKP